MLKKIVLPFIFILLSHSILAQSALPLFVSDSLDQYVERALKAWQIPGLALCIVKDNKVVIMKGYGIREIEGNDKVDENTLFMIGSNTKAFTGTAVAMLENEGKCTLDDKVQKYLPDFTMKDLWVAKELNLTDILCHRIGMMTFQGDFMYWTSDLSSKEVITKFGLLTPTYGFRTKYGYTNAGFAIAGQCIEKISGKPWSEFIKEKILQPLKMNNTLPLASEIRNYSNSAKPHTFDNNKLVKIPFPKIDNLAPAASIGSSVSDMSHWLIAQLDSGKYLGQQVIPLQVIQKTRKAQTIVGRSTNLFDRNPFNFYGLGWFSESYKGKEIISHTGGVDGFVTSVTLIPEEKLGIVVLTNTDANYFYQALKWEIIDAYMGLHYRNYDSAMFGIYKKNKTKENNEFAALQDTIALHLKPTVDLKEFTGRYVHDVYGYIDISQNGNELNLTFQHHPDLKAKLIHISGNRFLCTYSNPIFGKKVFPFNVVDEKVKSFTLSVSDFLEYTTYRFTKE